MDSSPLVDEQIKVGAQFLGEFCKKVPVQVAFWYKRDEGDWHLYVASDQITDENLDTVYDEVWLAAEQIQDPWFNGFPVKVIQMDDPLAKAALALQQRYPRHVPGRFPSKTFGANSVGAVYLYRVPVPAAVSGNEHTGK